MDMPPGPSGPMGQLDTLSRQLLKPLAIASAVGMWVVLLMGAAVTNTGSARGCADTWPLCRGQFIPQFAFSTAIEFSHRSVVAVLTVLIIALAICVWVRFPHQVEIRALSAVMVAFLFLQAGLGAWAVMDPQSAAVLALHFGVSLISFASVLLVAVLVFEVGDAQDLRNRALPRLFAAAVWATTVFSILDVYLGAYVRHRNAESACSDWPLCNGGTIPGLTSLAGLNLAHRAASFILALGIVGLILWSKRLREDRPDVYRSSVVAGVLVVLQSLSGAVVVATHLDLFSALLHAGLVALLFGNLCYLCLHVTRVPEALPASQPHSLSAEPA
jgi:cytochrome c oxidase assembly protein subunit 15